jgi:aminopeptidase N
MDKWLAVQASADRDDAVEVINRLKVDPVFDLKNPNKVRSLFGAFASLNFNQFHRGDGYGYNLLTDIIIEVDGFNAQLAANLSKQFSSYAKVDVGRQEQMKLCLHRILNSSPSNDVFEVVNSTVNQVA